jgi:hypothetical protein
MAEPLNTYVQAAMLQKCFSFYSTILQHHFTYPVKEVKIHLVWHQKGAKESDYPKVVISLACL